MCLDGAKVSHARFGEGKILALEKGYMQVKFGAPYGEKWFVYPDAFSGFLTLQEHSLEEPVRRALADKRQEEARRHRERMERLQALQARAAAEKSAGRASRARAGRKPSSPSEDGYTAKTTDKKRRAPGDAS